MNSSPPIHDTIPTRVPSFASRRPLAATFGPYRPLELIGRGGMAEVMLAADPRRAGVHRLVAVKRIHPHLLDEPGFVEMFTDEARIATQLSHPNVCRVFDHGVIDGTPFLAMEYLCGEPLSRLRHALAEKPALPASHPRVLSGARRASFIARIVADACEGLQAVHELRTGDGRSLDAVHRDVSPENLFLTCNGQVKVVDFGVVKANHKQHKTEAGVIKGKMAYLPPEVMAAAKIDRRADIWALGVIAWELCTGERLFRRESDVETLRAIMDADIPIPSTLRSDIPHEVDQAIMRALARDPARRYDSARAFGRALRDAAPGMDAADVAAWVRQRFGHDSLCHQRRALSVGALEADETSVQLQLSMPLPVTAQTPSSQPSPMPAHLPSIVPPPAGRWRLPAAVALGLALGAAGTGLAPGAVNASFAAQRLDPAVGRALPDAALGIASELATSAEPRELFVDVHDARGRTRLRMSLGQLVLDELDRKSRRRGAERDHSAVVSGPPVERW